MAAFIDNCGFVPTAGGTADWTYGSTVGGYQSPSQAGAINGQTYVFRAQSADLTQWEIAAGTYASSTGTFARTTVLYTSAGTTSKVNFSVPPALVAIIAVSQDIARTLRTRTVLTSGSGTYATPTGCRTINVRMIGGGAGGGNGVSGAGGSGANSTFSGTGVSMTASGGNGVPQQGGIGGGASGGDINIQGGGGQGGSGVFTGTNNLAGGNGGSGPFGGAGIGQYNANGGAAAANSGAGGGGGGITGSSGVPGGGGGAGGAGIIIIDEYY
ncbi:hypothetical protein ACQR1W_35385 [Bradyrhizobium sp. HKCCYLS1011]|uniref:hypothetical protein n=1 Tax=Bradyrhizobium sp. HKCCYLS1011 TaxID=3420733 RepID=UPI003EC145FC